MSQIDSIAVRRTKPNYLYAIISVALVLFLLGFFGLLILNAQQLVRRYKEQVNLIVEIKSDAAVEQVSDLRLYLEQAAYTRPGSIQWISKGDAVKMMKTEYGEEFLKLDLPNPFLDVVLFNLRAEYMQADKLSRIREELKALPGVSDVFYQENIVSSIANNLQRASYFALGLGLFFLLVAITLIHNTIRLALYSNRFLIKNMELVGASWNFISRPYLVRAILHGLLSSLLAALALLGLVFWISHQIPELALLQNNNALIIVISALLFCGVILYTSSTGFAVNKYLRMRADDLY
jgi:cell division transport system permease protein